MVCERWCVKDGVKDGVTKNGVVKEDVSKMVRERWCLTKSCVKDGV